MTTSMAAPWHKASFDTFFDEQLPQLLAQQLPLIGYERVARDLFTCQITLTLAALSGEVQATYEDLPQPDQSGVFTVKGKQLVVVPYATSDDLEQAEICCVGEQLSTYIQKRLGKAPDDLPWDASLIQAWLPLDLWIGEFFSGHARYDWPVTESGWGQFVQSLDQTNWLARQQHLRRLFIQQRQHLFQPGHFGRACPFETPEGPNIGRIVCIALGAEIQRGRLVIADERPEASLGLGAAMIPLLEHNAPERLLMGTNMLRQWLRSPDPEPALIQSGNEPDAPDFWCGRNLLTAFVSWGEDTFEDGIVLSASCARRLGYPHAVEPGDKFSNRHGTKGVVSRILPDTEMPLLADGTPVELVFNFINQPARASFGQIREAVLSRVARAEGKSLVIPPFHAPSETEIRARLVQAGLPEHGMERLIDGRNGQPLEQPSTVGWIYWGKLAHLASAKLGILAGTDWQIPESSARGQRLNEDGYYALREAGAFALIHEQLTTGSTSQPGSETLAAQLAVGEIVPAEPPAPHFRALLESLASVGIVGDFKEQEVNFRLAEPAGATLALAAPVAHPWLRDHTLACVGVHAELPQYRVLVEANTRVERILSSGAPEILKQQALTQLILRVQEYCSALLPAIQLGTRVQFSGRAVLAPGSNLRLDQVGLAEEIAWAFFGPFVQRELSAEDVRSRSARATSSLDAIMARSWVIIHRSPAITPQTFLAFHPVRNSDRVIRLHPLVCRFLQADFDGDQAAVFLPLTAQTQQEAGLRLSVAAHLERTPELLRDLLPNNEALWGLAKLSLTAEGKQEIASMVGTDVVPASDILTCESLAEACTQVLQRDGLVSTLEKLERLTQRGFAVARASGASISPFIGSPLALPPAPESDEIETWKRYQAEVSEWLAADVDYQRSDPGVQLLAVKSGAWGEIQHLTTLLSTQGLVRNVEEQLVPIRHGYRNGLTPVELYALAVGARATFAKVLQEWLQIEQEIQQRSQSKSFHVLARAMRAEQPAIVFAHAASIGESDPLTDLDSRLFVGLPARD